MQLPPRLRPTPTPFLRPPPPALPLPIIPIPDIVPQIAGRIPFGLTYAIAQPGEAVPAVHDVPVVCAWLSHCFEIVERAAGPCRRDTAVDSVVVVRGAAGVAPDGASHECGDVGFEVVDCGGFGGETVDGFGLVAVDEGEDVVGLGFWSVRIHGVSCVISMKGENR